MTPGLDVSAAQSFEINWSKVRDAGKRFSYHKANTAEGKPDAWFSDHLLGAFDVGLLCGAYHYALVDENAIDDVDAFLRAIDYYTDKLELPACIDIESRNGLVDSNTICRFVDVWWNEIIRRGMKKPCIYTSQGFWDGLGVPGQDPKWGRDRDLFVANYGVGLVKPKLPKAWSTWKIWQNKANTIWKLPPTPEHPYGEQKWGPVKPHPLAVMIAEPGHCDGVAGEVDLDVFNGSYDDLRVWAGLEVAELPNLSDDARVRG